MKSTNKNWAILIIGASVILITTVLVFIQMSRNHQENMRIIDECFERFDEGNGVVVQKEGFWSPVTCEKQ
ncbi:hypothetical protein MKX54_00440 [Alkalihalobacillus sp. FSL R5-0424]